MFGKGKPLSFDRPVVRTVFAVAMMYALAYMASADRWLLVGSAYALYLLPTIVAALRGRHRIAPVALVNFFFGWTVIGWIIALIWATTGETRAERLGAAGRALGVLLVVGTIVYGAANYTLADHNVEHRIAQFWARVDAMQPGDYLSSADLGQWALNVIERDARARISVADFRASTAAMQGGIGRAGPAPVAPPPPTPTPRTTYRLSESVQYTDGWTLTVSRIEEVVPGRYTTVTAGMRLVAVIVRFDNGTRAGISTNPYNFKLQDSTGVRRGYRWFSERNDELGSSEVAPGAFVVGSMTFEAPIGDKALQLIYEQYGYKQVTFQLY